MNLAASYSYQFFKKILSVPHKRSSMWKKKVIILLISVFLIIAGVLIGSSVSASSKSNAGMTHNIYKYYTSIEVQPGDTLWDIAEQYLTADNPDRDSYISEIAALNGLTSSQIHAGEYLTIPYYTDQQK